MKIEIYKDKNGDSQIKFDKSYLQASPELQQELCMDGVLMLNNEMLDNDADIGLDDES